MLLDLPSFLFLALLVSLVRKIPPTCFIEGNVTVAFGLIGLKSLFVASLVMKLEIATLEKHLLHGCSVLSVLVALIFIFLTHERLACQKSEGLRFTKCRF